jgi:hypothetical protein
LAFGFESFFERPFRDTIGPGLHMLKDLLESITYPLSRICPFTVRWLRGCEIIPGNGVARL